MKASCISKRQSFLRGQLLISVLFEKLLVHKLFKNKNTEGTAGRRSESLEHGHASCEAELQYKSDAYAEYGRDEERNI